MLDQSKPQSKLLLSQRTKRIVYSLLSLQLKLCYKDKAHENK